MPPSRPVSEPTPSTRGILRPARKQPSASPVMSMAAPRLRGYSWMTLISSNIVVLGIWVLINIGMFPAVPAFDPTFVVLAMVVSVEAIAVATLVTIGQARLS